VKIHIENYANIYFKKSTISYFQSHRMVDEIYRESERNFNFMATISFCYQVITIECITKFLQLTTVARWAIKSFIVFLISTINEIVNKKLLFINKKIKKKKY